MYSSYIHLLQINFMYSDKDLHFEKEDKDLAELFTKVPPTLDVKL